MYEENFAVAILDVAADRSVALGASLAPAVHTQQPTAEYVYNFII